LQQHLLHLLLLGFFAPLTVESWFCLLGREKRKVSH
jgi:hypothetical protein